jgi:hypothetical protein
VDGAYQNSSGQKLVFDARQKTISIVYPEGSIKYSDSVSVKSCAAYDPRRCYCEKDGKGCWADVIRIAPCMLQMDGDILRVTYDKDFAGFTEGNNVVISTRSFYSKYTSAAVEAAEPKQHGSRAESAKYVCDRTIKEFNQIHKPFSLPVSDYSKDLIYWREGGLNAIASLIDIVIHGDDSTAFRKVQSP